MMFNEFSHLDFISVVVADPTLPLALARAPALALLQEQATRTETWIGEEEIREEKKRKEEINSEDDGNGKLIGCCSRCSSLSVGGNSSPALVQAGARAVVRAAPASVLCVGGQGQGQWGMR